MTKPLALRAEVARVLRPGGVCADLLLEPHVPDQGGRAIFDRRKSAAAVLSEDRGPSDNSTPSAKSTLPAASACPRAPT